MDFAFDVCLRFFDQFIAVGFLSLEDDERRLAVPVHFDLENLRAIDGRFSVIIFFNEIDHQVQERIRATVRVDAVFVCDQLIRLQSYLWKTTSEVVCRGPVRGAALPVEYTGGSE